MNLGKTVGGDAVRFDTNVPGVVCSRGWNGFRVGDTVEVKGVRPKSHTPVGQTIGTNTLCAPRLKRVRHSLSFWPPCSVGPRDESMTR